VSFKQVNPTSLAKIRYITKYKMLKQCTEGLTACLNARLKFKSSLILSRKTITTRAILLGSIMVIIYQIIYLTSVAAR